MVSSLCSYAILPHARLFFPGRKPSTGGAPDPDADPQVAAGKGPPGRVLVVEDDWFIGQDIEATLRGGGYDVVDLVVSADEAVAATDRERPELVVMDIRLVGNRDGVDAAIEIRQRFDIPCLFVSAYDDAILKSRAAVARPAGWLVKPVSVDTLLATVRRALGH